MYNDNKVRADDFRVADRGWMDGRMDGRMDGWTPAVMTPLERLDKIPINPSLRFLISLKWVFVLLNCI